MDEIKEEEAGLSVSAGRKIIAGEGSGEGTDIAEQGGEGILKSGDNIFDLVDVVEEGQGISCLYPALNEEIMESVSQITEKIAREIIPDIAARVLREEIERFKRSG